MAQPANTFSQYDSVGNREDLSDMIYLVDPTETPGLSNFAHIEATSVNHEWQTQALASASGTNTVIEGDDATTDAVTATVRLGNRCQISDKVARVTGTQEAIKKAGRANEMAFQLVLKGLELKRDMETSLFANNAKVTGDDSTARELAGVPAWIFTNDVLDSGGSSPTGDGTDARTDGTQRAFTEAQLKEAIGLAWDSGGQPDMVMLGRFNKQVSSGFTGRGTPQSNVDTKKIIAAADWYDSDFGLLAIVPNRFSRSRDAHVMQKDLWKIAYLRDFQTRELARTGDSDRRQIIVEYTLQSSNEKGSAGVYDLTTS